MSTPLGSDLISLGIRAVVTLGVELATLLVAAIRDGDVHTTATLAERLDEPDRILARAEALKARQARKAAEALAAAQAKKGDGT